MKLDDSIQRKIVSKSMDENGDYEEESTYEPLGKGKCTILPNGEASHRKGEDGDSYSTPYVVFTKKTDVIPVEGDIVHIRKKDGSIDKDCTVRGYVTLKSWLKLWLE